MSDSSSQSDSDFDLALCRLVEELTERINRGEDVDFQSVLAANPQHAVQLEQLIPTLSLFLVANKEDSHRPFSSGPNPGPFGASPQTLGDFRLIRQVGQGGMGIVYEAEQISLNRRVALKVLSFAGVLDSRHLQRFKNESRAAAGLIHPNIVPVYAVGSERGIHFYAMQYIDGPTLADVIRIANGKAPLPSTARLTVASENRLEQLPLPTRTFGTGPHSVTTDRPKTSAFSRDADSSESAPPRPSSGPKIDTSSFTVESERYRTIAAWGVQIADALDYAHSVGVIHRDIKPANLMLDEHGHIWITDFGLAQMELAASPTLTGDILGTLRYMSPEQTAGEKSIIDQRTDVYSLGVTLYELLSLQPLFNGNDQKTILHKIAHGDPPPVRSINPNVPRDLETIVHKAIERDIPQRYRTAAELAEDLRRFLQERTIRAKPPTVIDRLRKWRRRNATFVLATTVIGVTFSFILVIGGLLLNQAEERARYFQRTSEAESKLTEIAERNGREHRYVTNINSADHALRVGKTQEAIKYLQNCIPTGTQADLRGFEWSYLWQSAQHAPSLLGQHQGEVFCSDVSANRHLAVTGGQDGARIWDLSAGRELFHLVGHTADVNGVSLSRDGRWLATASDDYTVKIWRVSDGQLLHSIPHTDRVVAAVFAPDSQWLATAERRWDGKGENIVRFWRSSTWEQDGEDLRGHTSLLQSLAVSPDGRFVATASSDQTVRVWEVGSRSERFRFVVPVGFSCVRFANNRPLLCGAGTAECNIRVWNYISGVLVANELGGVAMPEGVSISPNDSLIAISGRANQADILTLSEHGALLPNSVIRLTNQSWALSFVDNQTVLTTTREGTVTRRHTSEKLVTRISVSADKPPRIVIHPDGQLLAVSNGGLTLYSTSDGEIVEELLPAESETRCITFSSDGRLLAVSSDQNWIFIYDLAHKRSVRFSHSPSGCERLNFVAGNSSLMCRRFGAPIGGEFIDPLSGHPSPSPDPEYDVVAERWFSPSTDCYAMCQPNGVLSLRRERQELWHYDGLGPMPNGIIFSDDGQKLALCRDDGEILIWDIKNPEPEMVFVGRSMKRMHLQFTPDGKTLIGEFKGQRTLFSVATGRELMSLEPQLRDCAHCQFSRTGDVFAMSGLNSFGRGEILIWKFDEKSPAHPKREQLQP